MTIWLEDQKGYVDDIGQTGWLVTVPKMRKCPKLLDKFLETGELKTMRSVKALIKPCDEAGGNFKEVFSAALRKVKAPPAFLCDGVNDYGAADEED